MTNNITNMNKETYEALKRLIYGTIWKDTGADKKDVYLVADWLDEVAKDY